ARKAASNFRRLQKINLRRPAESISKSNRASFYQPDFLLSSRLNTAAPDNRQPSQCARARQTVFRPLRRRSFQAALSSSDKSSPFYFLINRARLKASCPNKLSR